MYFASDDAGAFILLSLVGATQRRRQLTAADGRCASRYLVADARLQKYEPGFTLTTSDQLPHVAVTQVVKLTHILPGRFDLLD